MPGCFHPETSISSTPEMPIYARSFVVGPLPVEREVRVEAAVQRDGGTKWKVTNGFSVYGRTLGWSAGEPMPSNRSDRWLNEYRFDDLDSALIAATKAVAEKLEEYLDLCQKLGIKPELRK